MESKPAKRKRGSTAPDGLEPIGAVFKRIATSVSGAQDQISRSNSTTTSTRATSYSQTRSHIANTPHLGSGESPVSGSSSSGDAFDFGADEETTRLLLDMGLMGQKPEAAADVSVSFLLPSGNPPWPEVPGDPSFGGVNVDSGVLGMR
jgi:hypothetical protein